MYFNLGNKCAYRESKEMIYSSPFRSQNISAEYISGLNSWSDCEQIEQFSVFLV